MRTLPGLTEKKLVGLFHYISSTLGQQKNVKLSFLTVAVRKLRLGVSRVSSSETFKKPEALNPGVSSEIRSSGSSKRAPWPPCQRHADTCNAASCPCALGAPLC